MEHIILIILGLLGLVVCVGGFLVVQFDKMEANDGYDKEELKRFRG